MAKASISNAAAEIIAEYEARTKRRVKPPIPVESIIERGLGLRLWFLDLRRKLGMDDVLGATFVRERTICVDQHLAENHNEGRICFTFAHETGHWVLHRNLVEKACRTGRREPVIFCRSSNAKQAIEWQADYFASCLLMPENAVRKAFGACFGSRPLVLYNLKSAFNGPVGFDPTVETWPKIATVVKEAGGFSNVSKQAMIIRLQGLGLVKNETRARLSWKASYMMT